MEVNQTLSAIKLRASTWLMLYLIVKRASNRLILFQQASFSPDARIEVCRQTSVLPDAGIDVC